MNLITTDEWGANDSRDATRDTHPIGPNPGVTLHWTGNGYGWPWPHARCFELVRGIERSHEYGNGWGDIAYNLLACPHGHIFEGRGLHVRSAANGDTARNAARYAVCYLGGTGDEFTDDGAHAMREAVWLLHRRGGARLDVNGHRDGWSTTCPGPVIYRWLNNTDWTTATRTLTEDDMPYTDWPQKDREALLNDLADRVWNRAGAIKNLGPNRDKNPDLLPSHAVSQTREWARMASVSNADEIATKVATKVGNGASAKDIAAELAAELIRQLGADE